MNVLKGNLQCMEDWSASAGNIVGEQCLTVEAECKVSASRALARAYNTLTDDDEPSLISLKQQKEPQGSYGLREKSHGEDIANLPCAHNLRPDLPQPGHMYI